MTLRGSSENNVWMFCFFTVDGNTFMYKGFTGAWWNACGDCMEMCTLQSFALGGELVVNESQGCQAWQCAKWRPFVLAPFLTGQYNRSFFWLLFSCYLLHFHRSSVHLVVALHVCELNNVKVGGLLLGQYYVDEKASWIELCRGGRLAVFWQTASAEIPGVGSKA